MSAGRRRRGQARPWASWALVAARVLFVWNRSLFAGPDSDAQSLAVVEVLRPLLVGAGVADTALMNHIVRKTAHFLEYAVLGLLLCGTLPASRTVGAVLARLALGVGVAGADETIQTFVPLRTASPLDAALDSAGMACGVALGLAMGRLRARPGATRP